MPLASANLLWKKWLILDSQLAMPSVELCHPLRSLSITDASTLLRDDPPLAPASVFFLVVSATCHFPSHPERSSHVPYQSLHRVHAAYTPAAAGTVNRFLPGLSWSNCTTPVSTALKKLTMRHRTVCFRSSPRYLPNIFPMPFPRSFTTTPFQTQQHRAV